MSRWAIGQAEVDQQITSRELQKIVGAAANGEPLLEKANRTPATAIRNVEEDPGEVESDEPERHGPLVGPQCHNQTPTTAPPRISRTRAAL